jgi:hypothetical protein
VGEPSSADTREKVRHGVVDHLGMRHRAHVAEVGELESTSTAAVTRPPFAADHACRQP